VDENFYATMAQVMPVVLLALVWDSRYLDRLRAEPRTPRRQDPVHGVRFWTRSRVRVFSITVFGLLTAGIAAAMLVLGGVLHPWLALRLLLLGILGLGLGTLAVRIIVDVIAATAPSAPATAPAPQPPGDRSQPPVG
jgi:hypothetical protein